MSAQRPVTRTRLRAAGCFLATLFVITLHSPLITRRSTAEAAVSKGSNQQLEVGGTNQGGGSVSSSKFRQQISVGESVAGHRISSSRFRIVPGLLGASVVSSATTPVAELDLQVLYAKTDPLGTTISAKTWQKDRDPIFIWEPPQTGPDVAGYSYAVDAAPDEKIDTTSTSFDIATRSEGPLADGKHTFSVRAVNSAGNGGKPISFELWVDTTAPQITTYTPPAGALLNTSSPAVSATVSDGGSGVNATTVSLLVNGQAATISVNEALGQVSVTKATWKEGANSLELRVSDAVGNAQVPLIWSVMVDTKPPTGTVTINAGAEMTTSLYVTLGLNATDATSGIARMLISNEELAGYVEEPYAVQRPLWKLNPVRGVQRVFVKFVDRAGNMSDPVSDEIDLGLLSPDTVITTGPAGFNPGHTVTFTFMCPEGDCVFSYAFDHDEWSEWSPATSAAKDNLVFGNHYFRVKAARELNGIPGIQPDEEDPSPAERTWIVGVEPPIFAVPKGPPIKVWRLE